MNSSCLSSISEVCPLNLSSPTLSTTFLDSSKDCSSRSRSSSSPKCSDSTTGDTCTFKKRCSARTIVIPDRPNSSAKYIAHCSQDSSSEESAACSADDDSTRAVYGDSSISSTVNSTMETNNRHTCWWPIQWLNT